MHTSHIHNIDPALAQHKQLVKQTQKWVAQTFYGTLLRQTQNSPFKDKTFSGGRGGEAFGEMLNQNLAEHMSRGSGSKLSNSIVDRIEEPLAKRANLTLKKWRTSHGIKSSKAVRLNVSA